MKKLVLLLALTFAIPSAAKAQDDAPVLDDVQEVQLDTEFETNQQDQLAIDRKYAQNEAVQSKKEFNREKHRLESLKKKNENLSTSVDKEMKKAQEAKAEAERAAQKTREVEAKVDSKEKRVEKLKISVVELRKKADQLKARYAKAQARLARLAKAEARLKKQKEGLHGRIKALAKKSKNPGRRVAQN